MPRPGKPEDAVQVSRHDDEGVEDHAGEMVRYLDPGSREELPQRTGSHLVVYDGAEEAAPIERRS